jgi:uncharacterized protein
MSGSTDATMAAGDASGARVSLRSGERLPSLDILRGLALAGMFVVHFHERSTEPGGIDDVVRTLVWRLVESKSHGTFALLFGAGFAIQFLRAEARGRAFTALYVRRLGALALFGFAAHALFGFNVLLGYAAWCLPLLMIRRWSTRALITTATVCAISLPLYHLVVQQQMARRGGPAAAAAAYEAQRASAEEVWSRVKTAERQESFRVLVAARLRHMVWFYRQPFFFLPGATLTLFIVGLLLVRHRVFEEPLLHRGVLGFMAAFGFGSWIISNWVLPGLALLLRDQWLTFSYVAAVLLVLARWPGLAARLQGVANAGRMALTNYLLQIAALDLLFSGYLIGLEQIRPVWGLAAALACFAAEVALSSLWLTRFRFGPAEWLWRSLSYGSVQPLAREAVVAGIAAR